MTNELEEMVDEFADMIGEIGLSMTRLVDVQVFPPFDGSLGSIGFVCECGGEIKMDPVDIGDTVECGGCGKNWMISVAVCAIEVK